MHHDGESLSSRADQHCAKTLYPPCAYGPRAHRPCVVALRLGGRGSRAASVLGSWGGQTQTGDACRHTANRGTQQVVNRLLRQEVSSVEIQKCLQGRSLRWRGIIPTWHLRSTALCPLPSPLLAAQPNPPRPRSKVRSSS